MKITLEDIATEADCIFKGFAVVPTTSSDFVVINFELNFDVIDFVDVDKSDDYPKLIDGRDAFSLLSIKFKPRFIDGKMPDLNEAQLNALSQAIFARCVSVYRFMS